MTTTNKTSKADSKAGGTAASVLPRRFLQPLLCLALSRAEQSYGYELAEAVRSYGLSIDLGGVYRELRSMEQHDLLTSRWVPSENGPDRRVYMTTAAGRAECELAIDRLRQARDHLMAALDESTLSGVESK